MKHGYGRWQAIVDDKDLRIQEVICPGLCFWSSPASSFQPGNFSVNKWYGVNSEHAEAPGNEAKGTTAGSEATPEIAHGATDTTSRSQLFQDQSMLYHFREMQRRQVEFIKKRVLLLEKGLNAELQRAYYADEKPNGVPNEETPRKVKETETPCSEAFDTKMIDPLPEVEIISSTEISECACDTTQERLAMARLFNEMTMILKDNVLDSGEASSESRKKLKEMSEEITQILRVVDGSQAMDVDQSNAGADAEAVESIGNGNAGADAEAVESIGNGSDHVETEEKSNPQATH
ncbi:hypothetical protein SASPL_127504 [Salvia splendens]|uniref:Uncharacterized protein n=1 Tax=Salvia splendens TaxID=180675 RepID=A0A8X8XBA8_SALSN|nr:hypothetical protein SASPL_127504 [Salvia splendens]